MKRTREALYVGFFDALPVLRDPGILILLGLVSFLPVIFIFVFAGGAATQQALVGSIVLSLAFMGLFTAQSIFFNKHWFRFQDIYVASPVSPVSYAMGLSLSTFIVSIPAVLAAFLLLLGALPVSVVNLIFAVASTVVLWIAMVLLGFVIGTSIRSVRRANSLPQILGFVLGFLPPVYYPIDVLPPSMRIPALLIPTTHAAQLAKYYFGLVSMTPGDVVFGWAYLIGFAVFMGLLATRRAHWTDR